MFFFDQHYQPGQITSQGSVLMILIAVSLCIMNGITCAIFLALIAVVA